MAWATKRKLLRERNKVMVSSMELHGQSLLDYFNGEKGVVYLLHREDGGAFRLEAKQFFYENEEFPEIK